MENQLAHFRSWKSIEGKIIELSVLNHKKKKKKEIEIKSCMSCVHGNLLNAVGLSSLSFDLKIYFTLFIKLQTI